MFADQLVAAVAASRRTGELDQLATATWRAWGNGVIEDSGAAAIAAAIEARRFVIRGATGRPTGEGADRALGLPKPAQRHRPKSPDRARSIARRRMIASSGMLPPHLACRFTLGEQAVLAIVAGAVITAGACTMTVDEIGGRAGVSASTVRNGIRAACRAGVLLKIERRVCYDRSLPNVLKIISRDWLAWLATRPRNASQGGGCKNLEPASARSNPERGLATNRGRDRGLTPRARRDL
jgi:hypothetical protein